MNYFYMFIAFLLSSYVLAAEFVPSEYIVKTSNKSLLKSSKHLNNDLYKVKLTSEEYAKVKNNVEYIEPNYIYHAYPAEDDVDSSSGQWGLSAIDTEKAWQVTKGSSKIIVGVIDTGVDYNHLALKDRMWKNKKEIPNNKIDDDENGYIDDVRGWNFEGKNNDPMDDNQHGTHCSGIIAANSSSVMGVAPNVTIMPLKFLASDGSGTLESAIEAINYGVMMGAKVLSNSWGSYRYSKALKETIEAAKEKGVLFIAAAGNEYNDNDGDAKNYPSSYTSENIISVAASDAQGKKAYFSNYGKESVDIFAPGHRILSTVPGNRVASLSGTSMATPFVAGVAALLFSKHPHWKYEDIQNALYKTVNPLPDLRDYVKTEGLVNAGNALQE